MQVPLFAESFAWYCWAVEYCDFFFFLTTYMPLTLGPSSMYASHLGLITVSVPLVCLSADFSPTLYY